MSFQPGINHRKWQLILIPLVSFIVANILSYNLINENLSYVFPWKKMLTLAFFTFIIWEVNIVTYKKLDKTNAFFENPGKRLLIQIFYSVAATWLTYALLYNVIYMVTGGRYAGFPFRNFLLFFLVATAIALMINALYVIRYLQSTLAYKEAISTAKMNELLATLSKPSDPPLPAADSVAEKIQENTSHDNKSSLLITSGDKILPVPFNDMAYWYSSDGLVILVLKDGKKITTNFSSYADFIGQLPEKLFFQLNRQYVTHVQSIVSIKDDVNRKLIVELRARSSNIKTEAVTVSRYRSQQLKAWFVLHAG